MKVPTKYVKSLTVEEEEKLMEIMKKGETEKERRRAHCIILNNKEYSIDSIAEIYNKHRNTISELIDKWEQEKFQALIDKPRSGRPSKLTEEEQEQVKKK
jgi:transposase